MIDKKEKKVIEDEVILNKRQKNKKESADRKWKVIQEAQKLYKEGYSKTKIAKKLKISRQTVYSYLEQKQPLERSTHSILDPFVPMIKKLLFYDIEEIKDENLKNDLREYLETNKELSELFKMIRKFKEIIFSKKPQRLKFWIEKAKKINVKELNSFITLIESDIDAVKNAIKYDYSNGLIEGFNNKTKVIKRIMYGRCSFDLLRIKILS